MSLSFNPKMLAHDLAKGLSYLNQGNLKKYSTADLKAIIGSLTLLQREVRSKQIPVEDILEVKEKNRQLQHINQALTVVNNYVKKHGIRL